MSSTPHKSDADTVEVSINNETLHVSNEIETVSELLEAGNYTNQEYELYLIDGEEEIGPLGEMVVFDEGDEFVAIPKYVNSA